MRLLFILLLMTVTAAVLLRCGSDASQSTPPPKNMLEILKDVPPLELPAVFPCDYDYTIASRRFMDWSDSDHDRLLNSFYNCLGTYKMLPKKDFTLLVNIWIGDVNHPIFYTLDTSGHKIDSLMPFQSYCGSDGTGWSMDTVWIDENLRISSRFHSYAYYQDTVSGDMFPDSSTLEFTENFYRILPDGQIAEEDH